MYAGFVPRDEGWRMALSWCRSRKRRRYGGEDVFPSRCALSKDRLYILSNVVQLITFYTQRHRIAKR